MFNKTAKELYGKPDAGRYDYSEYQPMLDSFGKIILQVDDDDYQGDSRVLYKDGERIGYLNFGWGSCSGCDALQACETIDDVQKLMDELKGSIKWFLSSAEAYEYFTAKDWQLDMSWHSDEGKEFVKKAFETLSNITLGG